MKKMNTKPAKDLALGDRIFPPEREMRLWMRREIAETNLSEEALLLTVEEIRDSKPDKKGGWLLIKGRHSVEWDKRNGNGNPALRSMSFRARPETPWAYISGQEGK
jgi:hypothetical protein